MTIIDLQKVFKVYDMGAEKVRALNGLDLEIEKGEIAEQIKEVKAEAKGNGFDVKIINKVVRIRKQDRAKRMEEDAILDLYLAAIGEI